MIQLAEDIEYNDSRKIPLDPKHKRVFIEVASNRKIDIAVVNAKQMKDFDDADSADDVADIDIDWTENTRNHDFDFEFPNAQTKCYLLFWNANEREDAIIAYKVTPIDL